MRRIGSAGLSSRYLIPKTVRDCLGPGKSLPYNWSEKLRETVLGICLARSVVLQQIARVQGRLVKTGENRLSAFLARKKLNIDRVHRECAIRTLRRLGGRKFRKFRGKVILIIDSTDYAKKRSRGKKRRMPKIGRVRLHNLATKETVLAPGYQEIWTALLLKGRRASIGITRKLHSTHLTGFWSQNQIEELEIRKAKDLVREALGLDVIVVADRGFRRKELLHWFLREEKTDFIIRMEGRLRARVGKRRGLLENLASWEPERLRAFWRESDKHPIFSAVRAFRATLSLFGEKDFTIRVLHLSPINIPMPPMLLATSMPISDRQELSETVALYSARWTIETFFYNYKQAFRANAFRVHSSWEAIDRLLAMAHMAFLVLSLIFEVSSGRCEQPIRNLRLSAQSLIHRHYAYASNLTLGKFFEILAMDFANHRLAWAVI